MRLTLSRESQPIFTRSQKKQEEVCVCDWGCVSKVSDKTVMCHMQVCVRVFSPVQGMTPVPLCCPAILWAVLTLEETYRSSAPRWSRNSWCTSSWSPACLKQPEINWLKAPDCRRWDFDVFLTPQCNINTAYVSKRSIQGETVPSNKPSGKVVMSQLYSHGPQPRPQHGRCHKTIEGTDADAWLAAPHQACESWPIKDDQAFWEGVLKRQARSIQTDEWWIDEALDP